MEIREILAIIQKRLIFIICIPILASATAAFISTSVIKPVYEASSTIYIMGQNVNSENMVTYYEILKNQQLVKDYRELIKSKLIAKTALDELQITNISPYVLSKRIFVTSKNATRLLVIKVQDTDPVRAKELSNKICHILIDKSIELLKTNNVSIVDTAEIPQTSVKPIPALYTAIAFLLSTLSVLGIVFLLEYWNDKIKTSEDIEKYLELNVLGIIPLFDVE